MGEIPAVSAPIPQKVSCCIAGGGPAGIMLGVLLARSGVETLVLEKHKDFLRDFRGDTVHPSTLDVIGELGLLSQFLARPHQRLERISAVIGDTEIKLADFGHTNTRCHYVALMPQWDFLDFLAGEGARYPAFHLRREAEVTGLIEKNGKITGIEGKTPEGPFSVEANLVIGADGRHSAVRACSGLSVRDIGAPIDVLWMRLSRRKDDPEQSLGRVGPGQVLVTIDRGDYWQCALIIKKGGFNTIREGGLPAFRKNIAGVAPFLADRLDELRDWNDISLLTVTIDRLEQWWRPGLLCIGDSAHAMSPIGGVGINLAIQDAVAAANILAGPLKAGNVSNDHLRAVQRRRHFPTWATQAVQVVIQERIMQPVLDSSKPIAPPWPLRLFNRWPVLRRLPARIVGVGFRPEHVRTHPAG